MVHYKKTNVAIKRYEAELAGTVVVDNTGDFFGYSHKAEDVGDGIVVDDVNEIEVRVDIGDIVVLDGFNKARHDGVRDKDRGTDAGSFRGGASNAFLGLFHVAF
jgi:hypothetical protein